jgi:hypothetical protein
MDVKPVLTSGFPFYFFMGAACFRLPKLWLRLIQLGRSWTNFYFHIPPSR